MVVINRIAGAGKCYYDGFSYGVQCGEEGTLADVKAPKRRNAFFTVKRTYETKCRFVILLGSSDWTNSC